jgi:hypothetical protein
MFEELAQCPLFKFSTNPDKCIRKCPECPYSAHICGICGAIIPVGTYNMIPGYDYPQFCLDCI